MRKAIFLNLIILFFINFNSQAKENLRTKIEIIIINQLNKSSKILTLDDLLKISKSQSVKIIEPHNLATEIYYAINLKKLLSHKSIYASDWKKYDELLFTCSDGYVAAVPVSEFLKYSAFLAYKKEGDKNFNIDNKEQNEKNIHLGPFYLIWDNINFPQVNKTGTSYWPYQITKIELSTFKERYPQIYPQNDKSGVLKEGFLHFKTHCMNCHSIEGIGGEKGPDLNTVTKNYSEEWLEKFIINPRSIRPESNMLSFSGNYTLKEKKLIIKKIISFLKSRSKP